MRRPYQSRPRFAAPLLGQHSETVMRDLLEMAEEEIQEVHAAGAIR